MKRLSFAVLSVFCLFGLIALTSCEIEIPADEAVTFTIYNKADCDLTIKSIGFDKGMAPASFGTRGWGLHLLLQEILRMLTRQSRQIVLR